MANTQKTSILFFVCFAALFLSSCFKHPHVLTFRGRTMGTTYSVKVYTTEYNKIKYLRAQTEKRLASINQEMSTYIPDSVISQINQSDQNQKIAISQDFYAVLSSALELAQQTQGIYDPTVGPLVNLWGFGPTGQKNAPSPQQIQETLEYVGYQKIKVTRDKGQWFVSKTDKDVFLDLSSIAKGYAVDEIARFLVRSGMVNFLIEIGGEMKAQGKKGKYEWYVGLEKPITEGREVMYSFPLTNQSLATSGNYRNQFKQDQTIYAHTINPKTGQAKASSLLSVSVLAGQCLDADALATALMALGEKKAVEYVTMHEIAALMIVQGEGNKLETKLFGKFKNIMD